MYRVETGNFINFKTFLASVSADWVNVILTDTGALLVQNSAGIFAALQLKASHSQEAKNLVFRISTHILKMMAVDGFMDISMHDELIHIDFLNNAAVIQRSITLPLQQAFTSTFNDKLAIFSAISTEGFDVRCLKESINLAKNLGSALEVVDNTVGILDRGGTIIYKPVTGLPNMFLAADCASKLFQCSTLWYVHNNYVFASNENYGIIVTQCRGNWSSEYTAIVNEENKFAAIFDVNFAPVYQIFRAVKCNCLELLFSGECQFKVGTTVYSVPVELNNYRASEKFQEKGIVLDWKMVNEILPKLGSEKLRISVGRNHLKIECNEFGILCRRSQS